MNITTVLHITFTLTNLVTAGVVACLCGSTTLLLLLLRAGTGRGAEERPLVVRRGTRPGDVPCGCVVERERKHEHTCVHAHGRT